MKIPNTIGDFSFLNQDSICISQKEIEGKIHVANFIFTSCGSIFSTMTRNMKIIANSLATDKDLVFLSFIVTPRIDKPNILYKYKIKK